MSSNVYVTRKRSTMVSRCDYQAVKLYTHTIAAPTHTAPLVGDPAPLTLCCKPRFNGGGRCHGVNMLLLAVKARRSLTKGQRLTHTWFICFSDS